MNAKLQRKAYMSLTDTFLQIPLQGSLLELAEAKRLELIERVAEVDEAVGELFLMEEPISADVLQDGIKRATGALKFVPVFMGRYVSDCK